MIHDDGSLWVLVVPLALIALVSIISMIKNRKNPKRPVPPTSSSRIAPDGRNRDLNHADGFGGRGFTKSGGNPPTL